MMISFDFFPSSTHSVSVRHKPDALVVLHDVALARLACAVQWLSFLPPAAAPPSLLAFSRRLLALLSATAIQVRCSVSLSTIHYQCLSLYQSFVLPNAIWVVYQRYFFLCFVLKTNVAKGVSLTVHITVASIV